MTLFMDKLPLAASQGLDETRLILGRELTPVTTFLDGEDVVCDTLVRQMLRNVVDLVQADSSVSDIAHRNGFAYLGRFSQVYRKQFGETPSETLRRGRLRYLQQSRDTSAGKRGRKSPADCDHSETMSSLQCIR